MDNAIQGRGTSNYELEFRTKSNEIRHLLVNATTRRDAENNVVGVVGVAQDVTEAVQRDRAVAGMANELRQLVDTANAVSKFEFIDGSYRPSFLTRIYFSIYISRFLELTAMATLMNGITKQLKSQDILRKRRLMNLWCQNSLYHLYGNQSRTSWTRRFKVMKPLTTN